MVSKPTLPLQDVVLPASPVIVSSPAPPWMSWTLLNQVVLAGSPPVPAVRSTWTPQGAGGVAEPVTHRLLRAHDLVVAGAAVEAAAALAGAVSAERVVAGAAQVDVPVLAAEELVVPVPAVQPVSAEVAGG